MRHRALAPGHVQLLDPLQGIRLVRDAQSLPQERVQVDEHLAAQEDVQLVLADGVAAHQALEGPRLVPAVVIDVHYGPAASPLHDEGDELVERAALLLGRMCPQRPIDRLALLFNEDAEQVLQPVLVHERIGLEVQEHVARRRCGQRGEAAGVGGRPGRDQLVPDDTVGVLLKLQPGLCAERLQRKGPYPADGRSVRPGEAQSGHRRHAGLAEARHLHT